jgi:hypothetical protein
MSFRAAHEVVARFIAAHEAAGEPGGAVRPELAEEPLRQYSTARLAAISDARSFVESRTSAGGTAATRRRELVAEAAADIDVHRSAVGALIDGVEQARRRLLDDARALVEPPHVVRGQQLRWMSTGALRPASPYTQNSTSDSSPLFRSYTSRRLDHAYSAWRAVPNLGRKPVEYEPGPHTYSACSPRPLACGVAGLGSLPNHLVALSAVPDLGTLVSDETVAADCLRDCL